MRSLALPNPYSRPTRAKVGGRESPPRSQDDVTRLRSSKESGQRGNVMIGSWV